MPSYYALGVLSQIAAGNCWQQDIQDALCTESFDGERHGQRLLAASTVPRDSGWITTSHPDPSDARLAKHEITDKGAKLWPIMSEIHALSVMFTKDLAELVQKLPPEFKGPPEV